MVSCSIAGRRGEARPVGSIAGIQPDSVEAEGDEPANDWTQSTCAGQQQLHEAV